MPELTDRQAVILAHAAKRDDRRPLPLPDSLQLNKGAAATVLTSLLRRGLLVERPAGAGDVTWRDDADGRTTLIVSAEGLAAIGVQDDDADSAETAPAGAVGGQHAALPPAVRANTKQALLLDLLRRADGATVGEIGAATGWQPHSVRGAISGTVKKKLGLPVASETVAGRGRVYRIAAEG